MKGHQEKVGHSIAQAIRAIEFNVKLTDARTLDAELTELGIGGARIEVRHPHELRGGRRHLVGIVSLEGRTPEVVYAVPLYRDALVRAVARITGGGR